MSEPVSSQLIELERLDILNRWFSGIPGDWKLSYTRKAGSSSLLWTCFLEAGKEMPRGYLDSVRQRRRLWAGLDSMADLVLECPEEESDFLISTQALDGEPVARFFQRTSWPADAPFHSVLLDVVGVLRRLATSPRLLSSISTEDFFVYAHSGVHLQAGFSPLFSVLREEEPRSEFQMARQWVETFARFLAAAQDHWRSHLSNYDPTDAKPFRALLKEMGRGTEKTLSETIREVEAILQRECRAEKIPEHKRRLILRYPDLPGGPLSDSMREAFADAYPEKAARAGDRALGEQFSNFQFRCEGKDKDSRVSLLLPQGWFDSSDIELINRRMSLPFLKAHPNMTRVRSILCEENFTALTGDVVGIPLPALIRARNGLPAGDVMRISTKLSTALSQFESADFHLDLHSPWQIELHPVDPDRRDEFQSFWLERSLEDLPAWDVKVRVECPPESYLPIQGGAVWEMVSHQLLAKPFPALVVWMLEWERLQKAAGDLALCRQPLSLNQERIALIEATMEYFENGNGKHRERFLELIVSPVDQPVE